MVHAEITLLWIERLRLCRIALNNRKLDAILGGLCDKRISKKKHTQAAEMNYENCDLIELDVWFRIMSMSLGWPTADGMNSSVVLGVIKCIYDMFIRLVAQCVTLGTTEFQFMVDMPSKCCLLWQIRQFIYGKGRQGTGKSYRVIACPITVNATLHVLWG